MNLRVVVVSAAILACSIGIARADSPSNSVNLARFVKTGGTAAAPTPLNPLSTFALRGGAMLSPRGAGLVGVDFSIPSLPLIGGGLHTRVDADVIFKANFGGVNTIIPVTIDQLYTAPTAVVGHSVYYGGGVGAVLSGPAKFDGKLLVGMDLASKIGAEFNVHFTEHDTLFTLLARLHM